ncbi:MAG: hypothetical protein QOK36_4169 [Gaiellales bacterium]|nr:hypothetical protein [Gaiellales bacterium]
MIEVEGDINPVPDQLGPGSVSIVVPCMNEEVTIGEFVDWALEGLRVAGVEGEVLIVDSSSDRSPEIAREHGATVLCVPKRGLGRAYIDAIPHIRGEWVVMGDCDLTYDFRVLEPFLARLRAGDEFVMGTRTRGSIAPGAMPRLHRYFGSPATTWIFNRIYGTRFSDIHCGMRAMTTDALKRMHLRANGWEYASEMILKAKRLGFVTSEVPVHFYADREGRESHLKRSNWTAPWIAGWSSLRVMFLYSPDFFTITPGLILFVLGALMTTALASGPITVAGVGLNLHWMMLGMVITKLGIGALQLGELARVHYDFDPRFSATMLQRLSYDRGVLGSLLLGAVGLVPNVLLLVDWLQHGLHLRSLDYSAVFGLTLMVLAFQLFTFTLLLHIVGEEPTTWSRTG